MPELRFSYGVMSAGKSTLALQVEHTWNEAGRRGVLLTSRDRGGTGVVSSRLGMRRSAWEVDGATALRQVLDRDVPDRGFVVADEVQFYAPEEVDVLAQCVDDRGIDVACFGLLTDFAGRLFPGSARLVELADVLVPLPLPVVCWCGAPARMNARLVDGKVVHEGEQVVLGDTAPPSVDALDEEVFGPEVHYQVLCRRHWRSGETGPAR
ncbi:MAG TPA: thymidine kinase [Mycobacteriales bacterium]|nr:thymidine kinase [Mycobacteriales bacterium]